MWIIRAKGPFTNIVLHIGNIGATFPTREAAEARLIGGVLAGQQTANWAPVEVDLPRGPCVPWCVLPDPDHVSVK